MNSVTHVPGLFCYRCPRLHPVVSVKWWKIIKRSFGDYKVESLVLPMQPFSP